MVTDIRTETEGVRVITLTGADGAELPAWQPGAHIDVCLPNGITRQYSLCGDIGHHGYWRFAVLLEPDSRGGSTWIHKELRVGEPLLVRGPRNNFPLVPAERYVFVAGGIGITPLLPMIREVHERGSDWRLTYGGRQRESMAFVEQLAEYGERVEVRPQREFGFLDLNRAIGAPRPGTVVYCCGPSPLIDAVERQCEPWPTDSLHVERFRPEAKALEGAATEFDVLLSRSGQRVTVAPDETIVEAVGRAGVFVPTSCGEGTCGTCETGVLDGEPDHRDSLLTDDEREANDVMMLCCSRSFSQTLLLDL
ncbi:MAG: oxidoreductase [Comamonadaceae bacterium]|nr:MAG: oxidoreductase [Comamonadaceae bacterium]